MDDSKKPRFLREKLLRGETGVDVKLQAKTFQRTVDSPIAFPENRNQKKTRKHRWSPLFRHRFLSVLAEVEASDSWTSSSQWCAFYPRSKLLIVSWMKHNMLLLIVGKVANFCKDLGVQEKFRMGLRVWRIGYPKLDDTDIQMIHSMFFFIIYSTVVAENVVWTWWWRVPFRSYSLQGEGLAPLAANQFRIVRAGDLKLRLHNSHGIKNQTFVQNTKYT